jgi:hypothetical protein
MRKARTKEERVERFLAKRARKKEKGWDYSDSPDLRQPGNVEHQMDSVLWALELGLTSNQPTLRDVEEMLGNLGPWAQTLVPKPISDTTLDTEARRLDAGYLRDKLVLRVRDLKRSKMLNPVGLPCGVLAVDGKNLATLDHDAAGEGHARSTQNEKWHLSKSEEKKRGKAYYLMPALRATLTSAEAKPCLYQLPLPPGVGESSCFIEMLDGLTHSYGRSDMFEVIDGDAGLTSLANADDVNKRGLGYIFGLKGNQPELFDEAQALLLPMAESLPPEAQTPWERRSGKLIRRSLWRTGEMAGMENSVGRWTHLRQTWLVRQETRDSDGTVDVEDRFFLTSLLWNYLDPWQILLVVRNHWGVETAFNSLDLQWHEDSGPWCTMGTAIWALGVLRLMAYNTAQILRRRRLRKKKDDGSLETPMTWRSLFKVIEKVLEIDPRPAYAG